jgi:hypothetical protein
LVNYFKNKSFEMENNYVNLPFQSVRSTEVTCINPASNAGPKTVFVFPPSAKQAEYMEKGVYIIGFENNKQGGTGHYMNFLLCNGDRSTQRDEGRSHCDHFMPEGSHNRIRSVEIYNCGVITGFKFFDMYGALLWSIGTTDPSKRVETVLIAEDERIIGVVAKLYEYYQSRYTDF